MLLSSSLHFLLLELGILMPFIEETSEFGFHGSTNTSERAGLIPTSCKGRQVLVKYTRGEVVVFHHLQCRFKVVVLEIVQQLFNKNDKVLTADGSITGTESLRKEHILDFSD